MAIGFTCLQYMHTLIRSSPVPESIRDDNDERLVLEPALLRGLKIGRSLGFSAGGLGSVPGT